MSTLNSISLVLLYALVALLFLERKRQKDKLVLVSTTPIVNGFFSGNGLPINTLGQNGDTYLDFSNGNIYKKQNNTWL